jgi:putative transposase
VAVLTELKNRGVKDVFLLVCDRLKGLPHFVNAVSPTVQTCIMDVIRATFRHASHRSWHAIA